MLIYKMNRIIYLGSNPYHNSEPVYYNPLSLKVDYVRKMSGSHNAEVIRMYTHFSLLNGCGINTGVMYTSVFEVCGYVSVE